MPVALMWMEARCDGIFEGLAPANACHETGPGGFYKRSDLARRDTERAGWLYEDNNWYCPVCRGIKNARSVR